MNLEQILTWLREREDCKLGQGATEQEIEEAATSLGIRFPEQYAEFLRRVGWLEWAYGSLYGLGKGIPPYLDVVKETMQERRLCQPNIPAYLLPIMNDGAGNHYCIFVDGPNRAKVGFWDHEHEDAEGQLPEMVGLSFFDWLNKYISDIPNDS